MLTVWLAVRRRRVGISVEMCENEREIIAKAALILVRTKTDARAGRLKLSATSTRKY